MKTIRTFFYPVALALAALTPAGVRADATASAQLSFTNITVSSGAGTFVQLTNWSGAAFAQATVSNAFATGASPLVTVNGDFSSASGSASASGPGGSSSASASVLNPVVGADNATGQGWASSWFMFTGGSGSLSVDFSVLVNGSLSVLTDPYGELALAETIFTLEVSGDPALFSQNFYSIGPSDFASQSFSTTLNGTLTLQYDTAYMLFAQADSEVSVSNIPEPGAAVLALLGGALVFWLARRGKFSGKKISAGVCVLLGAGGIAQATYIGADAPDVCLTCGLTPTRQVGGAASTSLTEGNLREDYSVATVLSGGSPMMQLNLVYNSYNADGSRAQVDGGLGLGWTHSYNQFLFQQRGSYFQMGADGRVTMYKFGTGGYTADAGYFETLTPQSDGSVIITNKFQDWWRFESVPGTTLLVEGNVLRLKKLGDRNGNVTTLTYSSGKLTQIQDTYGRVITLGYTGSHLTSITDPAGRVTTLQYDTRFRTPTRITDPDGKLTRYTYNTLYQMTKKIDRDGRSYFYLYRSRKPWAVVDGDGQAIFSMVNSNQWNTDRNALALNLRRVYFASTVTNTDGNGNVWRYQYDTNGYITRVTAPDGAVTRYAYDAQTRKVSSITNANGFVTRYKYDSRGNRTNTTDALGNTTTYRYDSRFNLVTNITDPNGRVTTYQYDSRGNRTNEVNPLSQTTTWTYDSHGNMTTMTDRNGHTTTYTYDATGNRTNTADPLGNMTTYQYDAVGNLIRTTDALGHSTDYTYDARDRIIRSTNALGGVSSTAYDGVGRQTTNTDVMGRTTTYQYDSRGRLTRMTDRIGGTTDYGYDGNNNRIALTNQIGNPTYYFYDSQNRRTAEVDATAHVTVYAYDGVGNLVTNIDRNGHATTYTYDGLNRRTTATDPLGNVTRYDYSTPGGPPCCSPTIGSSLVTRQEDALGHVTFYHYDDADRLVETVKKQGGTNDTITPTDAVTTYAYDPIGNKISATDPNGNTTQFAYDSLNRQVATTNGVSETTFITYDADGNVISSTSPRGNVTTYTYDPLHRQVTATDSVGVLTTNAYDAIGNVTSTSDALGHVTTYTYDGLDRRVVVTDPLGHTTTTVYDGVNNVITNIDRNANATLYGYDEINRRTAVQDPLGNVTTYSYDGVGNVTNITDANGHITRYDYDAANRRVTEVYPDAPPNTVTYTYDGVGNLITRTDQLGRVTTYSYSELYFRTNRSYSPSGVSENYSYDLGGRLLYADRSGWVDTFGYDAADRITSTTQNGQPMTYLYDVAGGRETNVYPSGRVLRYSYDARSRLTSRTEGAAPPIVAYTYDAADRLVLRTNRNTTFTVYAYDAAGRLTSMETTNSGGRVVGFGYDYDFEGNRLTESKRHLAVDSEAYQYDAANRLTDYRVGTLSGVTVPSPTLEKLWTLDPLGNWTTVLSNSVPETRTHGLANELLTINSQTFSYDFDGNLVQDTRYNYSYDEENRLTQVQRIADSAIVGKYFYDALGRRVISIVNPAGTASTNVFFYDNARLVEEQDATGTTLATYVYGNYIDEVVTMDRAGQTYYYHQNALWSPHALTDNTGAVVERYIYDAYGAVAVLDGSYSPVALNSWGTPHSAVGNQFLYTGRELDEETGLYFYRARFYDAEKGRFLQRDPIKYADSMNLYEYVSSSPVNFMDPDGREKKEVKDAYVTCTCTFKCNGETKSATANANLLTGTVTAGGIAKKGAGYTNFEGLKLVGNLLDVMTAHDLPSLLSRRTGQACDKAIDKLHFTDFWGHCNQAKDGTQGNTYSGLSRTTTSKSYGMSNTFCPSYIGSDKTATGNCFAVFTVVE